MELIVVTLANIRPGRDADVLARIRLISDTIRNAQGLIASHFYRGRGSGSYYLMLTTWEDDDAWKRAQERYNPKQLLLNSATEMLAEVPEQWFMRYLWGYNRPATTPIIAAVHLASIRHDKLEQTQRDWIQALRHQKLQHLLAFAFLARGANEKRSTGEFPVASLSGNNQPGSSLPSGATVHSGSVFLNLFSWGSEIDREDFCADTDYRALTTLINSAGVGHVLPLEPM